MRRERGRGVFLTFLVALVVSFLTAHIMMVQSEKTKVASESVFDRVMRTQTFRCGYGPYPPYIFKDPNTGKLSGIFFDYMEALGKSLHFKVIWVQEFGSSDYLPAVQAGRIDGMCAGIWPNAARAREIDFTRPVFFNVINAYARANDTRFDQNLARIDDPSVTVVTADGEMGQYIAQDDFPKAKVLQLPQLSSISEFFVAIASNKADVTFANPAQFALYDAQNPGKLRRIPAAQPLRVFGDTIAIQQDQTRLRRMLDTATDELISSGKIEKILARYKPESDSFMRVRPVYQPHGNE